MPRIRRTIKEFTINIQCRQSTYIEEFVDYNQDSTLGSVRAKIKTVVNELREKSFTLTFNGEDIEGENKKLKELISTHSKSVTLLVDVSQPGGTSTEKTGFPEEILGDCQRTTCTVYQSTMTCIQMDCGCWFSWEGLRGEVKRQYNLSKYHKLKCFHCKEEWKEVSDTIWVCGFNKNDTQIFEKEFCKRKRGTTCVSCPSCGSMGKRKRDVTIHRLACGMCGVNFCLHCEKKWTGSGMVLCGNTACKNYNIEDQLQNCKVLKKDTNKDHQGSYYRWIEWCGDNIPILRACPKCLLLIRFKDKCQHMTCPACEHEFCYICLQNWKDSNGNTIHSYVSKDKQCKTAPRQKFR